MRSFELGGLAPADFPPLAEDFAAEARDSRARLKGTVSVSVVSMMAAGSLGSTALAQEATPLPKLEVTAKAKPKKKPPARSAMPARAPAPATVPQPAVEPVAPAAPTRGVGATNNVTPASGNVLESGTGLGRLPGTIQELPQTVNVVSEKIIEEQNATTLGAALRNVPGVTVNLGEGGAGMNGDQFRIRGFQAKGDIYIDGLRDFGVYVRDTFNVQEVQVIKGPTAESFGMGTGGGAINLRTKTPHLGNANYVEGIAGMGPMYRSIADVNRQLNGTTAIRLVGMWTEQEFVDRDLAYSDRWGFFGTMGFGLGTDTTLILDYFRQSGKRRPDTGVPFANPSLQNQYPNLIGRPVTEYGADRSNFYGKKSDLDDHDIDMLTSRFQKQLNPWLTFYNDTRFSWYNRYFAHSFANCDTIGDGGATQQCSPDVFFDRNLDTPYRLSANGFTQEAWGGQNISTLVANFNTGFLKHQMVAGIDAYYQEDRRIALTSAPALAGTIAVPDVFGGQDTLNIFSRKRGSTDDFALFASERLWFTDTFSVLGGVRWDDFHAKYNTTTTGSFINPPLEADTDFTSPKASVIWEPTQYQTYYASWAQSYSTIAGQFISNDNNGISDETLDPELNELWELGAKVSVMNGRLGLTGALFRIDKDNALVQDPITGLLVPLADNQSFRVEGFEFGLAGQLTEAWSMQLAYAFLDSEVTFNSAIGTDPNDPSTVLLNQYKGNEVPFAPPNTFSIWTTYELSKLIRVGPGKFLVGGGVVYSDEYFTHARNGSIVPAMATLDGLLSYEVNDWNLQVNGYNLTDELGYDGVQFNNSPGPSRGMRGRAVPIPGRTVLFTVAKKF